MSACRHLPVRTVAQRSRSHLGPHPFKARVGVPVDTGRSIVDARSTSEGVSQRESRAVGVEIPGSGWTDERILSVLIIVPSGLKRHVLVYEHFYRR